MVNFGPLASEIVSLVWVTPADFNGFRVLAALQHGTPVLGVSQILRRSTEGTTCIRQASHHVGHWPTFLVLFSFDLITSNGSIWWHHLANYVHLTVLHYHILAFYGRRM